MVSMMFASVKWAEVHKFFLFFLQSRRVVKIWFIFQYIQQFKTRRCLLRKQIEESGHITNSIHLITLIKPIPEALVRNAIAGVVGGIPLKCCKLMWQPTATGRTQQCWLTSLSFLSSLPEVWAQDMTSGFHLAVSGRRTFTGSWDLCWPGPLLSSSGLARRKPAQVDGHMPCLPPPSWCRSGMRRLCEKEPPLADKGCRWTWAECLVIEGINRVVTETTLSAAHPCLHLQLKWSLWDF